MSVNSRAYRIGAFALEIEGQYAGYISKVDVGKLVGDVHTNQLAVTNRQKKQVVKMKHDPIKFDVGVGMGHALYQWIRSSFDNKHIMKSGAVLSADHDYKCMRRLDFTNATITEISLPKFSAKDKGNGSYFSVTIQPETCRITAGDGNQITGIVGDKQKLHQTTNFRLDNGLPTKNLMSIDALKWTQKVTEHATGEHLESIYVPCSMEVGNLKMTVAAVDYQQWYDKAQKWFIEGQRSEADEISQTLTILGPDAKKEIGTITFENCGMASFQFAAMEANKDGVASFDVEWYTEAIKFDIREYNA